MRLCLKLCLAAALLMPAGTNAPAATALDLYWLHEEALVYLDGDPVALTLKETDELGLLQKPPALSPWRNPDAASPRAQALDLAWLDRPETGLPPMPDLLLNFALPAAGEDPAWASVTAPIQVTSVPEPAVYVLSAMALALGLLIAKKPLKKR